MFASAGHGLPVVVVFEKLPEAAHGDLVLVEAKAIHRCRIRCERSEEEAPALHGEPLAAGLPVAVRRAGAGARHRFLARTPGLTATKLRAAVPAQASLPVSADHAASFHAGGGGAGALAIAFPLTGLQTELGRGARAAGPPRFAFCAAVVHAQPAGAI